MALAGPATKSSFRSRTGCPIGADPPRAPPPSSLRRRVERPDSRPSSMPPSARGQDHPQLPEQPDGRLLRQQRAQALARVVVDTSSSSSPTRSASSLRRPRSRASPRSAAGRGAHVVVSSMSKAFAMTGWRQTTPRGREDRRRHVKVKPRPRTPPRWPRPRARPPCARRGRREAHGRRVQRRRGWSSRSSRSFRG